LTAGEAQEPRESPEPRETPEPREAPEPRNERPVPPPSMSGRRRGLLVGVSVLWVPLAFLFDGVTTLVLPLRVGPEAGTIGAVSFVGLAIGALLQPFAGRLSDLVRTRLDRRGFIVVAAAPAVLGMWLLVGTAGLAAALAGYVLVQAGAAAIQAGQQTLIPEHVMPGRQGRAAGLKVAFDVGGAFVAFSVLGALLAGGELLATGLAITAAVALGIAVLLALVPPVAVAPSEFTQPVLHCSSCRRALARSSPAGSCSSSARMGLGASCCCWWRSDFTWPPQGPPTRQEACSRC
jgi:MFS family permease